jgi:hypothetical protein
VPRDPAALVFALELLEVGGQLEHLVRVRGRGKVGLVLGLGLVLRLGPGLVRRWAGHSITCRRSRPLP